MVSECMCRHVPVAIVIVKHVARENTHQDVPTYLDVSNRSHILMLKSKMVQIEPIAYNILVGVLSLYVIDSLPW